MVTHTSTHTSKGESGSVLAENIRRLVLAVGSEEKSVKEMMEAVGLNNRPNFLAYSLVPAVNEGLIKMKSPIHPGIPDRGICLLSKGWRYIGDCLLDSTTL